MEANSYRISELAEKAGVTKRTVHYYIGRGLLPPAQGEGLASAYGEGHLLRLLYIKRLQDAFLPLEEIRKRLSGMSDEEVRASFGNGFSDAGGGEARAELFPGPAGPAGGQDSGRARYERVELGLGIELHVPAGSRRAGELAEMIAGYAKKLIKEG